MVNLPVFLLTVICLVGEVYIRYRTVLAPCRADMQIISERLQKRDIIKSAIVRCKDLSGQSVKC